MKKLLIALLIIAASCSKPVDVTTRITASDPSVVDYKFYEVWAGANPSVAFDVTLNIADPSKVESFQLYKVPAYLRWEITNPVSKKYTIYDHVQGDYPTYASGEYWYFQFKMKDGTFIKLTPFQVY